MDFNEDKTLYYDYNNKNYDNNYHYNQTEYTLEGSFFPELIVLFFFSYTTAMICRCFKGCIFPNNSIIRHNTDLNINERLIQDIKDINKNEINFDENLKDLNCTICLEEYTEVKKIIELDCKHNFHEECIDDWILKNQTCPLCRLNLL